MVGGGRQTMKPRTAHIALALLFWGVLGGTAVAATSIADKGDLAAYSDTATDASAYILNPGSDYSVTSAIDISADSRSQIIFNSPADTLTLDNTGNAGTLLAVRRFDLIAGGLAATGGGSGSASPVGLKVTAGGFSQTGGTVAAAGGTVTGADGINIQSGGYTLDNGALIANGGSSSNTIGVRVGSGDFTVNGGSVTASGGSGSNANGIWIPSSSLVVTGGTVSATGSASVNNVFGIRADRIVRQTGGIMTLTGGLFGSTYGLSALAGLTLGGTGTLNATGGSAFAAYGLNGWTGTITVGDAATLNATGGSASGAHGVYGSGTLVQNGGDIVATGGTFNGAYGMSGGALIQNGGTLAAYGNSGFNVRGVSYTTVTQNSGGITATGSNYTATASSIATAFFATNLTQYGGSITASGGGGDYSRGMSVNNVLTKSGTGSISATGGAGVSAFGLSAPTLAMNGGTVDGYGGGGTDAYGVRTFDITQTGGEVYGKGGTGTGAYGVHARDTYTISNGSLTGEGGAAAGSRGVYAGNLFQNGGTVRGSGGAFASATGLYVADTLSQSSGTMFAQGGSGANAYGVETANYVQSGGEATAIGGSSATGYGLYVSGLFDLYGTLRLERPDRNAASVYVAGNGLTLRTGSVLVPVVDVSVLDATKGAGLISTGPAGSVTIESGATVSPWFADSRSLVRGVIYSDYVFIDTGLLNGGSGGPPGTAGVINGEFANSGGGLTIEYTVRKSPDGSQYWISYERVMDIPDVLSLVPCENARRLLGAFEDLYETRVADPLVTGVIAAVDHSRDMGDLLRFTAHLGKTMTPQAYAKLTGTQLRTMELLQNSVFRQLDSLVERRRNHEFVAATGSAQALASPAWDGTPGQSRWHIWAEALYQQSSRFEKTCLEFDSAKEKLHGLSTGIARDSGMLALAASFGYVKGSYKANYSDTGVDNFGVTLAAKVHDLTPRGGWFNPWAGAAAGYAYADIDQRCLNFTRDAWKRSSPGAHMYRAALEAGNDFPLGGGVVLTPILGVEYAHIRQGGYNEYDPAGNGLCVSGNGYDSLRPRAGLAVRYAVSDKLVLGADANYRYETLDRNAAFAYSRLSDPGVVLLARGEKRKRASGSFGARAEYRITPRASVSAEYDLILEDKYAANRFAVGFGLTF